MLDGQSELEKESKLTNDDKVDDGDDGRGFAVSNLELGGSGGLWEFRNDLPEPPHERGHLGGGDCGEEILGRRHGQGHRH